METIRARCPGCQKLYGVEAKDVKDRRPEFVCKKCGNKFWFEFPPVDASNEVPTYLKEASAASVKETSNKSIKNCPKCKAENPQDSLSCLYCGIVFEKFGRKGILKAKEPEAPVHLKSAWDNVLVNYEHLEIHEKFISDCVAQKQLMFASAQYRKMLDANPNDPIALKMRDKIIGIATLTFVPPKRETAPVPKITFSVLFLFLGLLTGSVGLMFEKLRIVSMVGFGVAVIAGAVIGFKIIKSKSVS